MSDRSFENAPDMGHDFDNSRDAHEIPLEYDAQHWELTEEPEIEIEKPSEKHPEMHLRPGGALEEAVHAEIDSAARARILEAQQQQSTHNLPDEKELNFSSDFEEARRNSWGWDPESKREYEAHSEEENGKFDNEPFETGKRFKRKVEQERCDSEWER